MTQTEEMIQYSLSLARAASYAANPHESLHLSQAALNVANAMTTIECDKRASLELKARGLAS